MCCGPSICSRASEPPCQPPCQPQGLAAWIGHDAESRRPRLCCPPCNDLLPEDVLWDAEARYLEEPRGRYQGQAALLALPRSVEEVSILVREANAARVPVVPYGGGTGLVGGQVMPDGVAPLVISLERMAAIRAVYARENVLIAEGGHHSGRCAGGGAGDRAACSRCHWRRKARRGSAATLRPMRAASTCCATAMPATSAWGWRRCCPRARSGTGCRG